ncbi:MAG: type I-C CRISPR-associated protein Cas8c/Csd1 [Acidobacteriota bacterium]|nr:type I-C CRISPR-associated protein Cas8c/Csd1 [Acidobacteriota bacterium]
MTILQSLVAYYERIGAKGEAPPFGYSEQGISYALVLSMEGALIDVQDLEGSSGSRRRPLRLRVPQPEVRSGRAVKPNFLWDKTGYALGTTKDESQQGWRTTGRGEFEAFKESHLSMLAASADAGLRALAAFLRAWRPENYGLLGPGGDMLDKNVVFRLDDGTVQFLHDRPAARRIWEDRLSSRGSSDGLCLVTGEHETRARVHPKIKGVWGATSAGASLVSFNLDAFNSFGRRQGDNAPVSERAAFAYVTALNALLSHDSRQRVQIGDASTVFWAEAASSETAAKAAEDLFSIMAAGPSDEQEAAKVRDKLLAVAAGRPLVDVAPDVQEDTRIFVLGLAPNAARLSIRFWHEDSIGSLANRLREHWQDLTVDPAPRSWPPAVWQLLRETAVQRARTSSGNQALQRAGGALSARRRSGNVPPALGGALMRAILTGGRYPRSLLAAVVARIRADKGDNALNSMRAAICRAVLARDYRLQPGKEAVPPVTLHEDSNDIAYNLGRLFAAYAYAEKSVAARNATIRDKYVGSASATPLRVFPVLMRGYEHNRAALAKAGGKKAGSGVKADRAVGRIVDLLPPALPRALGLEEQARFFIGYYHQEQAFYAKGDPEGDRRQGAEGKD